MTTQSSYLVLFLPIFCAVSRFLLTAGRLEAKVLTSVNRWDTYRIIICHSIWLFKCVIILWKSCFGSETHGKQSKDCYYTLAIQAFWSIILPRHFYRYDVQAGSHHVPNNNQVNLSAHLFVSNKRRSFLQDSLLPIYMIRYNRWYEFWACDEMLNNWSVM